MLPQILSAVYRRRLLVRPGFCFFCHFQTFPIEGGGGHTQTLVFFFGIQKHCLFLGFAYKIDFKGGAGSREKLGFVGCTDLAFAGRGRELQRVSGAMSSLSRELVFLILQFLDEEKFKETVHKLEQESGFFFNMKYFEDQVRAGEWEEVERYLSGFTKVDDNRYSMKIFFEIRKQKYLEALDKQDRERAVEILAKDLKVFSSFNEELFKEVTQLLTLDNLRENEQLSKYGDAKSARNIMIMELKKLIEANPLFRDKLTFPAFKAARLRTLINQSLNWQH